MKNLHNKKKKINIYFILFYFIFRVISSKGRASNCQLELFQFKSVMARK